MITNKQILELASKHLYCECVSCEWSGKSEDILKFAQAIYEEGYNEGNDNGWESRAESEYTNSGLAGPAMTLVAIFYHHSNILPVVIGLSAYEKFIECCELLPTDWAHLMNQETGEILLTWRKEK